MAVFPLKVTLAVPDFRSALLWRLLRCLDLRSTDIEIPIWHILIMSSIIFMKRRQMMQIICVKSCDSIYTTEDFPGDYTQLCQKTSGLTPSGYANQPHPFPFHFLRWVYYDSPILYPCFNANNAKMQVSINRSIPFCLLSMPPFQLGSAPWTPAMDEM
jgi:hypothetical protein